MPRWDGVSIFDIVVRAVGIGRWLRAVVFSGDVHVLTQSFVECDCYRSR
jgi:hypothetical protein